jgi:hypothetical protein
MVVTWAFAEVMLFATLARITGIGLNMAMAAHYRIPTFEARAKFILALLPDWKTKELIRTRSEPPSESLDNSPRHETIGSTAIGAPTLTKHKQ